MAYLARFFFFLVFIIWVFIFIFLEGDSFRKYKTRSSAWNPDGRVSSWVRGLDHWVWGGLAQWVGGLAQRVGGLAQWVGSHSKVWTDAHMNATGFQDLKAPGCPATRPPISVFFFAPH